MLSGNKMNCNKSYYAHPTAVVESETIGEGTRIWHFAHVRAGSKIGRTVISERASISISEQRSVTM